MDTSVFMDKAQKPDKEQLKSAIRNSFKLWKQIRDFVVEKYPKVTEEWNFPGKNYGWSFRIKDKKRAIIYLLPRNNCFKAAFVFGQKASMQIMESNIDQN